MFAQRPSFQTLDLKWLIIISIIMHSLIIMTVQVNKKPIIIPLEIDIVLEKIIETPPPEPVEKLPEILPVEPIKFDPIPEPMVQEVEDIQSEITNTIPIKRAITFPKKSIDSESQQKIIESYGALLARHISAFKKYPRIAQRRVWEGNILLEITLSKNSKILNIKVINESKYGVLNKEAVAMIERAQPLPKANNIINETFKVIVPVAFKLK